MTEREMDTSPCVPGRFARLAIALCLTCGASPSPVTAATNAHFTVSATVMPHTAILASSMPEALEVSALDVERGFVEVLRDSQVVVTNNNPGGFELNVWPVGSVFSSVSVYGFGAAVSLDADGGSVVLRDRCGSAIPMRLNFHFRLAPGTAPGRYPWPLHFSIHPISSGR